MSFPRPLSNHERYLVRWMLQNGDRHTDRKKGMTILSDYLYGSVSVPFGAFVFAHGDTLGGLEVYGYGEPADRLPNPEELRPMAKTKSEQGADGDAEEAV